MSQHLQGTLLFNSQLNPSFALKFSQLTVVIHFLFCALSIFAVQYTNFKLICHLKANKQDFNGWHKFNTVYTILYMYIITNKIGQNININGSQKCW